jgi:hypothetical protein
MHAMNQRPSHSGARATNRKIKLYELAPGQQCSEDVQKKWEFFAFREAFLP